MGIFDGLGATITSPHRFRRDPDALLVLEAREHVDNGTRPETEPFAATDPASPIVEEICLLTDGLTDAVARWRADHGEPSTGTSDARVAA